MTLPERALQSFVGPLAQIVGMRWLRKPLARVPETHGAAQRLGRAPPCGPARHPPRGMSGLADCGKAGRAGWAASFRAGLGRRSA
jgi:hypothetical protein